MIDRLVPQTRKLLIKCRCLAMGGELTTALHQIDGAIAVNDTTRLSDQVALVLIKAELLYLDCRDQEALDLIEHAIKGAPPEMPQALMFVLRNNRSEAGFELFHHDSSVDFYRLADEQQLAGFHLFNALEIVSGEESAASGEHFDALPVFWRELVRTYQLGCWRPFRWAAKRIARECLALGEIADAAYYAILARERKVAEVVGKRLLAQRDPQVIRVTIEKCLTSANLLRHFDVACEILRQLGDAIPDAQLDAVAAWVQERCSLIPDVRCKVGILSEAWKTIVPVAQRLTSARASELIRVALEHPYWLESPREPKGVFVSREEMVTAVTHLLPALPREQLPLLAERTVPLATTRRQMHDYPKVINLLCNLAELAGDEVKQSIRVTLFPPGQGIDPFLAQAAPLFQQQQPSPEQLADNAVRAARNIRLQVQRLAPGQEFIPFSGMIMSASNEAGGQRIVVSGADSVELHALSKYRHHLQPDSLLLLVDAVLDLVRERENIIANRIGLVRALMTFVDRLDHATSERVFAVLGPVARGEIDEPTTTMTTAEAMNPLNPTKFHGGDPSRLRGISLVALARIVRVQGDAFRRRLEPILEQSLSDTSAEVRRLAYAASRELPSLSDPLFIALLLGTRDPDEEAAASAFVALAMNEGCRLTRQQWHLLLYSVKLATQSSSVALRRTGAGAMARLLHRSPPTSGPLQRRASELLITFSTDICASVRTEAAYRGP